MGKHWWEGYPWRTIQTNLREIDMEDMDSDRYVQDLKDFNATIVMINTGGIIASYETSLEDEYQSQFLHGDTLSDIISKCHENGIKVIARMDFSKIREPIYQRHPEWAFRKKDGSIVNYNGDVHACVCGGYQQEYAKKILREVLEKFDIDGFYFNMGGFNEKDYSYNKIGICHCDNCKRKFREMFGLELPESHDMDDPVYRKYIIFKDRIVKQQTAETCRFIKSINPEVAVNEVDYFRMESNTEYRRPLPFYQYSASSNTRTIRGIDGHVIASNTCVDFVGFYFRHIAVGPAQFKLRLYQDLANLGGLDYYLMGRLDNHLDKSGFENVKKVFAFHKENEKLFRDMDSESEVLLFKSWIWDSSPEERGWVRALTESHVIFDEVMESKLTEASDFSKYRTIIIPSIRKVDTVVKKKLSQFVKDGGNLIVVYDSGKYDESYNEVANPFGEEAGINEIRYVREDMESSMLIADDRERELFSGMKDYSIVMVGDKYIYADYSDKASEYMKLIPPHMYGPPERCYFTQISDFPGLTVNSFGKGKCIFIPWEPGRLYYQEGYDNTLNFMKDVILNVAGNHSVSDTSRMVEVTYATSRSKDYSLVQLVNATGHFGTSYFEPIPVRDIRIELYNDRKIESVNTICSGKAIEFKQEDGKLSFTLPELNDYECIRISYKK